MIVELEWQGDGGKKEVVALFFLLTVKEQAHGGFTRVTQASGSSTEDVKLHYDILLGCLWEAPGLDPGRQSQGDEGESNWEGPGCAIKSP